MGSFIIGIITLIAGYFLYGTFVEKIFKPDAARKTPAYTKADGVDYVPLPAWKVYMIQFLNIAGTGPIFGAIMGAKFGPSSYLWIVFGCIFAGAVHDYLCGMISIRNNGAGIPDLVGKYLGPNVKKVMLFFSLLLLLLVGTVFVYSPALILGEMTGGEGNVTATLPWIAGIFGYYIIATLLPIDKIIGKIYPVFAFALIFMAVALMVCMFIKGPDIPEIWDGLDNLGPSIGLKGQSIFPCLFITIACGAISGFHSTQSPMMARCLTNEKLGRPIFFGAMITEGIVALIWAAVSSYFFFGGGAAEVGGDLNDAAPTIVTLVSNSWLGLFGGILAILGVVSAPITSGDTAFRSARMIVADAIHLDQKPRRNRIRICIPLFLIASGLLIYNISDENGFNVIWRYFGWANQALAVFVLWMETVYLATEKKNASYLITEIPALFLTVVVITYLCSQKIGFNLSMTVSLHIAMGVAIVLEAIFHNKIVKNLQGKKKK